MNGWICKHWVEAPSLQRPAVMHPSVCIRTSDPLLENSFYEMRLDVTTNVTDPTDRSRAFCAAHRASA